MKKIEKEDLIKVKETIDAWVTQNQETWSIVKNRIYSNQLGFIGSYIGTQHSILDEEIEFFILKIASKNLRSIWDKFFISNENQKLNFIDICSTLGITYKIDKEYNIHDLPRINMIINFDVNKIKTNIFKIKDK